LSFLETEGKRSVFKGSSPDPPEEAEMAAAAAVKPETKPYEFKGSWSYPAAAAGFMPNVLE